MPQSDEVQEYYRNRITEIRDKERECCDDNCCTNTFSTNVKEKSVAACCSSDEDETIETGVNGDEQAISLGCSFNLLDHARLQPNETVVDLGSGPGHDLLGAAKQVKDGAAIGIDFTSEMIELAQQNAEAKGIENVKLINAEITETTLQDGIADVVISNCVINLVKDKRSVFAEAYRILKFGGRLVIADMITDASDELLQQLDTEDFCACVGGATSIQEYLQLLEDTGFSKVDTKVEGSGMYPKQDNTIPYKSVIFTATKL